MRALKYRNTKRIAVPVALPATFLAASLATTLGSLGINVASAQSNATDPAAIDIEACQTLSDSTALDQDSIKTRMACYSRDVAHLTQLVSQLIAERDELEASSATQTASINEYKKELAQRQDAMQRLEERAANLQLQIDEVTADRNEVREQLFGLLSDGKDQPVQVEANKKLFEDFSESYVSQTNEIQQLRDRLREFENRNTEISDQQLATQIENQQLQTQNDTLTAEIAALKDSVTGLESEREELKANLAATNSQVESIKNQLLENADIAQQRLGEIAELRAALDDSEKQRSALESTIARVNEEHLKKVTELTNQAESLTVKIDALNEQQLTLQAQATQAGEESQATIAALDEEITRLTAADQENQGKISELTNQSGELAGQLAALKEQQLEQQAQATQAGEESQATIAARDEEIAKLTAAEQENQEKISELISQSDELAGQIDTLKEQQLAQQEQAKQAGEKSLATIAARDEEIIQLNAAKQELNTEREKLIENIAALEASHLEQTKGYKDQASQLEQQIASITSEKTDLGSQLQEQKSANEQLRTSADESNQRNAELDLAANELREKLTTADAQAVELQASIDQLGQQSADEKAKFTEQVSNLNSTIEQNKKERDTLAAELDTVKPQLQTAEASLRSSEEQNSTLAANVDALEQKLAQAATEQENLKASLLESENKSQQVADNLASLKNNADTLTSLLAMSRAHSENADATLKQLRSEMSDADSRLAKKQTELEALLAEKTRIENNYKQLASKARSQAQAIEESLIKAGHDNVEVAVSDDNTIGILLGSGQLFRTGSSRLSGDGQQMLSDLAKSLELADDRRIMISGHSDNVPLGPKLAAIYKDNWGLSMARALSTATFFTDEADIPADRMSVSGFGATKPIGDNETLEGRQQNRRVEITLIPAEETVASAE